MDLSKDDLKAIIHEVISEFKGETGGSSHCCGGLSPAQCEVIQEWTQEGGFTDKQMDALKGFGNALVSGKKYILVGIGIVAILALQDVWGAIWKALHHIKLSW